MRACSSVPFAELGADPVQVTEEAIGVFKLIARVHSVLFHSRLAPGPDQPRHWHLALADRSTMALGAGKFP